MTEDITVYVRGGEYSLPSTLALNSSDSGTNGFKVLWQAYANETPVITGGQTISGWVQEANGIYSAPTGGLEFLQFYVNGERGVLAREPEVDNYRTMSWNEGTRTINIRQHRRPVPAKPHSLPTDPGQDHHSGQGGEPGHAADCLDFGKRHYSRRSRIGRGSSSRIIPIKENRPYFLDNALSFLDSPGEFYVDPTADRVYYKPRAGEDLQTAVTVAPRLEQLLRVEGTLDSPVQHVEFRGLTFQETTWTLPLQQGFIGDQGSFRYVGPLPGDSEYTGPHPGDEITSYPSQGIVAAVHVGYAHNLTV